MDRAPAGWRWVDTGGVPLLQADALGDLGVVHAFSTRQGGVSRAPWATLNLGRAVGDDPEAVRANRARLLGALGRPLADHVEASQVHGAQAAVVDAADRGRKVPAVDILLTADPRVVVAMHSADCVPLLLADPGRGAVAAVHAGWRGLAADAPGAAVRAMAAAFGSRPEDLYAAVGPAIGPCCYEVDAPVLDAYAATPWREAVFAPAGPGRWRLDLSAAAACALTAAGVGQARVVAAHLCTACRPDLFFSHRRDRHTGRMAAVVAAPD